MNQLLLQSLIISYGAVGVVSVLAYWPTIKDLYHHQKPSANITSYVLWSITTGISFLYSIFIVPDTLFIIVSGCYFVGCFAILLLILHLKYKKNLHKIYKQAAVSKL
jgi:hypothetical protein